MKKMSLAVLFSLSAMTSAAFAQSDQGVTMSTDPQRHHASQEVGHEAFEKHGSISDRT